MGYAQLNVLGHSWGAMLALIHAAAHPNAVARQVLVGVGRTEAPLCGGRRRRPRLRRGQQVRCRARGKVAASGRRGVLEGVCAGQGEGVDSGRWD
ncbi:MAG: alpha/beta fold hydrolase [Anaerolineae bacterium]